MKKSRLRASQIFGLHVRGWRFLAHAHLLSEVGRHDAEIPSGNHPALRPENERLLLVFSTGQVDMNCAEMYGSDPRHFKV